MDSKSAGLGVLDVIQIVFIVLKLCHLINWSWWVVLIPLWISLAIILILVIVLVVSDLKFKKDLRD